MKSYEKPIINDIELSKDDIIQTSTEGLIPKEDDFSGGVNWSLRSQSDADGNVFQK